MANEPTKQQQKYFTPRSDVEILSDQAVIAEPLLPANTFEVKPLRDGLRFRWENYKSRDGLVLQEALALGWDFATVADVECLVPFTNNKFINGDVVLMKMPSEKYERAIKANALRAKMATGQTLKEAVQELHALNQRLPADRRVYGNPIVPFSPSDEFLKGVMPEGGKIVQTNK